MPDEFSITLRGTSAKVSFGSDGNWWIELDSAWEQVSCAQLLRLADFIYDHVELKS